MDSNTIVITILIGLAFSMILIVTMSVAVIYSLRDKDN